MKKYRVSYERQDGESMVYGEYGTPEDAFHAARMVQSGYWVYSDVEGWGKVQSLREPVSVTVTDVEDPEVAKTPQDWVREFYPVPADSPEARSAPATHSLRKWRGVRPATLKQYGLSLSGGRSLLVNNKNGTELVLNAKSCALCRVYSTGMRCGACPLKPADQDAGCGSDSSYDHFRATGDPEPLIAELERAAAAEATR